MEAEKATPLGGCSAEFWVTETRGHEIKNKPITRDHSYSTDLLKDGKKGSLLRVQHASCMKSSLLLFLSTSLLPQMANNPLTVEGATALVTSVRKNPNSMMEEINISVRAYVLESLKVLTLYIFRNYMNPRAAPSQNCSETCCLLHLCTAIDKNGSPSGNHMEIIGL